MEGVEHFVELTSFGGKKAYMLAADVDLIRPHSEPGNPDSKIQTMISVRSGGVVASEESPEVVHDMVMLAKKLDAKASEP